jgi:invasion protein IalB
MLGASSFAFAQENTQKAFDQWQVICGKSQAGVTKCVLGVGLVNSKKQSVFRWTISPDKDSKANKITITTLTGVSIGEGISVRFGESEPVRIPFKLCMPKFCAAEIPFSDNWLKTFKSGKNFSVSITAANGKELKYDVSLSKFSAAYEFYTSEVAKTN